MPENYRFRSEVTQDLPTYKEFNRGASFASPTGKFFSILLCAILILFLLLIGDPEMAETYIGWLIFVAVFTLVILLLNRGGGINYKRMLQANNGQPSYSQTYFCEDAIYSFNESGAAISTLSYNQIIRVAETQNLFVLMLKYNMGIIVPKATLTGGDEVDFTAFLAWQCPKWKSQKVQNGTFQRVVGIITLVLLILTLILAICNLPSIRLFDKAKGTLTNDMTYSEMAEQLKFAGITISDQAIQELEQFDADYAADYGEEYYSGNYSESKVYDLLYWEAYGFYDEETWEWTPSRSGVYYFDTEVMYVDSIYSDFFTGLSAMHADLSFTNVTEDYSNADLEEGIGTVDLSFTLNGNSYTLTAEYLYDWFDTDILTQVAAIIADHCASELYIYYDGQGCLLYYGTPEQLTMLETLTGLDFKSASSPLSLF